MNEPIPQPVALTAIQIQSADLPHWEELPPEQQRELIMALAALLMTLPEVSHEPIA